MHFKLRAGQEKVLQLLVEKKNVIARLPTGYGKSFCYTVPAEKWRWKVVVLSPLKALMDDQQDRFSSNIRILNSHSGISEESKRRLDKALFQGNWDILFLSPEKFSSWQSSGKLQRIYSQQPWQLMAIDEAHCAVDWKGFRSAYESLDQGLHYYFSLGVRFLALSATLESTAKEELCVRWPFSWESVDESLGRENLFLRVDSIESSSIRYARLLSELKFIAEKRAAIVYVNSRREADHLAQWYANFGATCVSFHAGLSDQQRKQRAHDFQQKRISVIFATTAFGLGIDAPHVQKVIHWALPASIGEYWQQAGRAGRDGSAAESILFFSRSDILRWRFLDQKGKKKIIALLEYCFHKGCRKHFLSDSLNLPKDQVSCDACDYCRPSVARNREGFFFQPAWWEKNAFLSKKNFIELLYANEPIL